MRNFNERRELCQKLGLDSHEISVDEMENIKGSGWWAAGRTAADGASNGFTTCDYSGSGSGGGGGEMMA